MEKPKCGCRSSTGIHESPSATGEPDSPWGLTFGRGELDQYGYWATPCNDCARYAEAKDGVPIGSYWPFPPDLDAAE